MDTLPPWRAREFEELIMVPRGGIEYMAGGTLIHLAINRRALVGISKSEIKTKSARKEEQASLPSAEVCLTTDISSYTAKAARFPPVCGAAKAAP